MVLRKLGSAAVLLATANAWCCRSCANCMCTLYGVCKTDSGAALPPLAPIGSLTIEHVAGFVDSLRPGGTRQTCPARCPLPALLNGSRFAEHRIDGFRLAQLIHEHEARTSKNMTLRRHHGDWLASSGLLPDGLDSEQYIAIGTRLRDALRQAGALGSRRRSTKLLRTARA